MKNSSEKIVLIEENIINNKKFKETSKISDNNRKIEKESY